MTDTKKNYILLFTYGILITFCKGPLAIIPIFLIIFQNNYNIYALLLLTPILGFFGVIVPGFTISKIIVFYFIFKKIILFIVNKIPFKINKEILILFLFIVILTIGGICALIYSNGLYIVNGFNLLNEIINKILKVLLCIVIIIDFSYKSKVQNLNNFINNIFISITLLILPIIVYALTIGSESIVSFGLERSTVVGMDQNDLSVSLNFIIVILIFNIIKNPNKLIKLISSISLVLCIALVIRTLSRTGMLILAFILIITILAFNKGIVKKVSMLAVLISTFYFFIIWNIVNIEVILDRFLNIDTSSRTLLGKITAGRTEMWIPSVKYIFENCFFLGFGASVESEMFLTKLLGFSGNVVHNLYLELFIQTGFLGGLCIITLIGAIFLTHISKRYRGNLISKQFITFKIMLLSLCISGFSLNLAFREIFWILLGFNIALMNSLKLVKER